MKAFYRVFFRLLTDHKSLKYIFTQKDFNGRQQRLLKLSIDYNIQIKHHMGKANAVVDVLIRQPIQMRLTLRLRDLS